MTKADGRWHKETIQSARVERRPTRLAGVRAFFHRLMPGIVKPPVDREYLRTASGRLLPIHVRIPSAEGVRFYGSTLALPGEETSRVQADIDRDWEDPLAVEVGLGVGPQDIPADGWPDRFNPETARKVLEYLRDED